MTKTALAMDDGEEYERLLRKLSPEDLAVLRWQLQRRPSQVCPDPRPFIWILRAGRGCIAAGTLIYDPITKTETPVEWIKGAHVVLALTPDGPRPAEAEEPFLKGYADLHEVILESGRRITVTDRHRFLTPEGWVEADRVRSGTLVAVQKARHEDALRSTHRELGCPLSYSSDPYQDDAPLRSAVGSDSASSPSPIDALERNQPWCGTDEWAISQANTHRRLGYGPPSRSSYAPGGLPLQAQQSRDVASPRASSLHGNPSRLQSQQLTFPESATLGCDQGQAEYASLLSVDRFFDILEAQRPDQRENAGWSDRTLCAQQLDLEQTTPRGSTQRRKSEDGYVWSSLDDTTWERIVAIHPQGAGAFYDLHVPGPENYLAQGIWHHNSGKTYTASNHIFELTVTHAPLFVKNRIIRVALVGETSTDVKHTMIEGSSGLLGVIPPDLILAWNRTMGELRYFLPQAGADGSRIEVHCQAYSSERPDQLRGPEHAIAWIDEAAKLRDANEEPMKAGTTFSNLVAGLRTGASPHLIVTGTPTGCKLIKYLDQHPRSKTTVMASPENAGNVAEVFQDVIGDFVPGTRAYREEVLGEITWDTPDALFYQKNIEANRRKLPEEDLELTIGYDPSLTGSEELDESGIVITGHRTESKKSHSYVLEDHSGHYSPKDGTGRVIDLILEKNIRTLTVELNAGVDFVMTTIEQAIDEKTTYKMHKMPDKKVRYGKVRRWKVITPDHIFFIHGIQSTQGKQLRAETASIAYENNQVHHVKELKKLEEQMTTWSPVSTKKSPDRLDALVFCLLHIYADGMRNKVRQSKLVVPPETSIDVIAKQGKKRNPYDYEPHGRHASLYSLDVLSRD